VSGPVRTIRRIFFKGVTVGIGVYAGLCILGFAFQGKIVYHPIRSMDATPTDGGMSYDDIFFEAADGVKLNGWFVPADDARGVVIFCHGNAGNISNRLDTLRIFHALRLSTLIFDYRGYGLSDGKPSEEGTYLDAEAAWRHLTEVKGIPPEQIFVHGRSLGGAIAADLAAKHRPRGLILESTLTSVPDRAAEIYFWLPARVLSRFRYDTENALRRVQCPVLIVHSLDDRLIPFSHGRALEQAAPGEVDFLEISGDHNWGFVTSGERYTDGLGAFVEKALHIRYPASPD